MLEPTKLANLDNLQKAIKLGKTIEHLRARQRTLRKSKKIVQLVEKSKLDYYNRTLPSTSIYEVSTEFLADQMQKLINDKQEELHQLGYTI